MATTETHGEEGTPPQWVVVEAVAWVTRFVGGTGSSRVVIREELRPGDTVRSILRKVSARFPKLDEALWDRRTDQLGEHVEVIVNDALLGADATLDSELAAGDRITLVGQFMGG